jgi:serine/threonine protein kinase
MGDFSWSELRSWQRRGRALELSPGELLFGEGEPGESLYLVRRGVLEIFSGQQSQRRIALRRKGEVVGEMALLEGTSRSASARSLERTRLLCWSSADFHELLASKPRLALRLSQLLSHRMRDFQHEVQDERSRIGPYQILEQIGRGGMGSVFRAQHLPSQQMVALKVLHGEREEARLRFRREGEVLARLEHPHIVKVYESGQEGEHEFLALELLAGETLEARLRRGPLSLEELGEWFLPVVSALQRAHQEHIYHRDIKPANILKTLGGTVKLLDFGLALEEEANRLSHTGEFLGTPNYFAPERAEPHAAQLERYCDQYSLGITLFEAATGELPFKASQPLALLQLHLYQKPPSPRHLAPQLSADFENLVLRLLEKDPLQRFADLQELERALAHALGKGGPDTSETLCF